MRRSIHPHDVVRAPHIERAVAPRSTACAGGAVCGGAVCGAMGGGRRRLGAGV